VSWRIPLIDCSCIVAIINLYTYLGTLVGSPSSENTGHGFQLLEFAVRCQIVDSQSHILQMSCEMNNLSVSSPVLNFDFMSSF